MNSNYDEKAILDVEGRANNLIILDESQLKDAAELLKTCKLTIKEIEADRVKITKPINESLREINAKYNPLKDRVNQAIKIIEKSILSYNRQREEQLRLEAEKKRQEEIEKARQEAEKNKTLNEIFGDKSKAIMSEVYEKQAEKLEQKELKIDTTVRTGNTTTSIKKVWTYEIICEDNIPVDFQSPDHKKIMEAIKSGKREIAGLRIYQNESLMSR